MIDYQFILICSAFGFVWSEVLTREGMIFGEVGDLLSRLPEYMKKPLYSCAMCVTGFWTLSASIAIYGNDTMTIISPILSILLTKALVRYV